jgi:hypothetical protein
MVPSAGEQLAHRLRCRDDHVTALGVALPSR